MSAPIQASASVHVVPASNCVRSSTRIPESKPGDTGVTSIADSSSGKEVVALAKGGAGGRWSGQEVPLRKPIERHRQPRHQARSALLPSNLTAKERGGQRCK